MDYCFDKVIDRTHTQCLSADGFRGMIFHENAASAVLPCPDEQVIHMGIADMELSAPPCVLKALHDRVDHGIFGYTAILDDSFPDTFHAWCTRMYGWDFPKEALCYSHGIVPALYDLTKHLCKPDEKVLFFTPSYGPFKGAAVHAGLEFVCSELIRKADGSYSIDFEDFAQKASDPAVTVCIFCNPHNPTGRIWTDEELLRVGQICLEHGITILSDEIHCDLLRSGRTHIPFAKLFPDSDRIVTCMAPSKTFNIAGLQFSTVIIPNPELREFWKQAHDDGENPLSLVAAQAAYSDGGYDWLMALRQYLDGNFAFASEYLHTHAPMAQFAIPEATYLAWVDVSAYTGKTENLKQLVAERAGVAVNDGGMFVRGGEGFLRLNLAAPRSTVEEGLSRICRFLNTL